MVFFIDRIFKSEDFLAIAIILIATLSALILTYNEIGTSDVFYLIITPLFLLIILTVSYEVFKALLRTIGREMEKGKKEVEVAEGKFKASRVLVICPKCKTKNVETAKFCVACGEKLS